MSTTSAVSTVRSQKTILGHPAGLFVLFFTEMWERFSYYGMRALLVLYMVDYLIKRAQDGTTHVVGFAGLQHGLEWVFGPLAVQALASQVYGLYTAFVYFTPLFGGMLADKVLGQRKTVVIGGALMAIGHFLMAVESLFLPALFFLILGNGCFKPNISTQVGSLYPEGDPRLDRAYTIFYAGVNLGAFFSPLVCGTLGQVYGWHYGFAAAGVGMVLGLILYLWGQRFLAEDTLTRSRQTHAESGTAPLTRKQWSGIIGLVVLMVLNIVFWAVYEQQGNTVQLFADRNADWHVFGWQMPSTWFQAFNPMFIFMLTPLLNMLWGWQSLRKKEPSSVAKMAAGCVLLGVSFLPLMYLTKGLGETERISFLWLVGCTFVYTVGEMYLSPIGLALVVKVAPSRLVSMLMGMWYMSNFFGNYLSGYIGSFYEKISRESFFLLLAAMGIAAGIAIFALQKPLKDAVGHNT
ncbi:MAG TPA: peptide MFS transporter [Bryobacteraceae bacterium]|jgi:POT family proton-dependent oligopeptide transporter